MGFQKLAVAVGCAVLFGGSFAAAFVLLKSKSGPGSGTASAGVVKSDDSSAAPNVSDSVTNSVDDEVVPTEVKGNSRVSKSAPQPPKNTKPFTCADATKQGRDCIGQRVAWTGKWHLSQSATIDRQKGAQHIFYSPGSNGVFSFEYPFIAEEPKPLELAKKGESIRENHARKWGPTGIVTVTGTIARIDTLILIGEGTRYNVPVLTDVKITITP